MTIQYPLTMPTEPGIARVTLRAANVVGVARSPFTGQQQVQRHQGQWWAAEIELPPLVGHDLSAPWVAFLLSLRGQYGTFLMGDPGKPQPRGVATGSPVVDGANQTGERLTVRGFTANVSGILRAGDYIQLGSGGSARLHTVLLDADSDSTGRVTLDIWPRLRSSPANGSAVITRNPVGVWRLASSDTSWVREPALRVGLRFSAVEAL